MSKGVFRVFFGSQEAGQESYELVQTGEGFRLTASGKLSRPVEFETRNLLIQTDTRGRARKFEFKGSVRGIEQEVTAEISDRSAENRIRAAGQVVAKSDPVHVGTFLLPNLLFSPYVLVAHFLESGKEGHPEGELHAYVPPQAEIPFSLTRNPEKKRLDLWLRNAASPEVHVVVELDERGAVKGVHIPSASLSAYRESYLENRRMADSDHIEVLARELEFSSAKVSVSGVLTIPRKGRGPWPGVLLLAGSGAQDRDETVFGIRILGEIAEYLTRQGYVVFRYDKRGSGKSGGELLGARLQTLTNDALTALEFLKRRPEVQPEKIVILGHSEGGIVAASAAAQASFAGLILIGAPACRGEELLREQLSTFLAASDAPPNKKNEELHNQQWLLQWAHSDRPDKELESKIPAPLAKVARSSWFRDWLDYDPNEAYRKVRIPTLVAVGGKDMQVPPRHAENIYSSMRAAGNSKAELRIFPDVNHLLTRAKTGHFVEYENLPEKRVASELLKFLAEWLGKTLSARGGASR